MSLQCIQLNFKFFSPALFNSVEPNTSDFSKLFFVIFPLLPCTSHFNHIQQHVNHWTHQAYSSAKSQSMYSPSLIFHLLSALRDSYTVFKIQINITHCLYLSPGIIIRPTCASSAFEQICIVAPAAAYYIYVLPCLSCQLAWAQWSFYSFIFSLKFLWVPGCSRFSTNICQSAWNGESLQFSI